MKILATILVLLVSGVALTTCASRPFFRGKGVSVEMEATGYCKCGKCCGWRRNLFLQPVYASGPQKGERKKVGITASGARARVGTIAADTGLYPFGTKMFVPGYGWGVVEDRGGAIKGQRIDLFHRTHRQALEWGRKKVTVRVVFPD